MNKNLEYISEKNKDLISFLSSLINYHYNNTLLIRKNDSLMFNFFLNEFISKDLAKKSLSMHFSSIMVDIKFSKNQNSIVTVSDNSNQIWLLNFYEDGSLLLNSCWKALGEITIFHEIENSFLSTRNGNSFLEQELGRSILDNESYDLISLKYDIRSDLLKIDNFYFKDVEYLNKVRGFYE